MAYSDFLYPDVVRQFGLCERLVEDMFAPVSPIVRLPGLSQQLELGSPLAVGSHHKAARATWLTGPVLAGLWTRFACRINLLAGIELCGDPAEGLEGELDFIVCLGLQRHVPSTARCVFAQASGDDPAEVLGQAIAGMVGAQRYNRREGHPIEPIYGCVTTGSLWRFLHLSGTTLTTDLREYSLAEVDKILGILSSMLAPVVGAAAA